MGATEPTSIIAAAFVDEVMPLLRGSASDADVHLASDFMREQLANLTKFVAAVLSIDGGTTDG